MQSAQAAGVVIYPVALYSMEETECPTVGTPAHAIDDRVTSTCM